MVACCQVTGCYELFIAEQVVTRNKKGMRLMQNSLRGIEKRETHMYRQIPADRQTNGRTSGLGSHSRQTDRTGVSCSDKQTDRQTRRCTWLRQTDRAVYLAQTDKQTGRYTWLTRFTSGACFPTVSEHPGRVPFTLSNLPPFVALTRVPVPANTECQCLDQRIKRNVTLNSLFPI